MSDQPPQQVPDRYWNYPSTPADYRCPECGAAPRTPCHNPDPATGLDTFTIHPGRIKRATP